MGNRDSNTKYRRSDYQTDLIIPVWGHEELAYKCIQSIRENTPAEQYQITVIDNGCNRGVFDHWIRNQFGGLNIIALPFNHGFIRATNLGIAASLLTNSEYVLLMNSDTRVEDGDSNWLLRLTNPLVMDGDVGAVGAVSKNVYGQQRRETPTKLISHYYVSALIGFCLLLRKEAIAKVGLLDERFEPGNFDDFDYSLRLHKAGYKLAVAESVFIHHEMHASFKELDMTQPFSELLERNQAKLLDKWGADALKAVGL